MERKMGFSDGRAEVKAAEVKAARLLENQPM